MLKVLGRHKLLQDKVAILFIASFPFSNSFHPFFICIFQDWLSDKSLALVGLRSAPGGSHAELSPSPYCLLSHPLQRVGTTSPTILAGTRVASLLCTPPFFSGTLETLPTEELQTIHFSVTSINPFRLRSFQKSEESEHTPHFRDRYNLPNHVLLPYSPQSSTNTIMITIFIFPIEKCRNLFRFPPLRD